MHTAHTAEADDRHFEFGFSESSINHLIGNVFQINGRLEKFRKIGHKLLSVSQ